MVISGLAANRCANETDSKILPLEEGYKRDHAIEFSHKIHAQVDCKYCHNEQNDEKEGIQAAKVCMNCHKQVTGDSSPKNHD